MICIIDYGMGNIGSIENMLSYLGEESVISSDKTVINSAQGLILPGVGNFDKGMEYIESRNLKPILDQAVIDNNKPILGICLGMQLFGESSEEGKRKGLSWIKANSKKLNLDSSFKVPHMGWNYVAGKKSLISEDLNEQARFYFVHSYHMVCQNEEDVLFRTNYGFNFTSGICKENIYGVQFHPEKSHRFGMKLFENFIRICCQ